MLNNLLTRRFLNYQAALTLCCLLRPLSWTCRTIFNINGKDFLIGSELGDSEFLQVHFDLCVSVGVCRVTDNKLLCAFTTG